MARDFAFHSNNALTTAIQGPYKKLTCMAMEEGPQTLLVSDASWAPPCTLTSTSVAWEMRTQHSQVEKIGGMLIWAHLCRMLATECPRKYCALSNYGGGLGLSSEDPR